MPAAQIQHGSRLGHVPQHYLPAASHYSGRAGGDGVRYLSRSQAMAKVSGEIRALCSHREDVSQYRDDDAVGNSFPPGCVVNKPVCRRLHRPIIRSWPGCMRSRVPRVVVSPLFPSYFHYSPPPSFLLSASPPSPILIPAAAALPLHLSCHLKRYALSLVYRALKPNA